MTDRVEVLAANVRVWQWEVLKEKKKWPEVLTGLCQVKMGHWGYRAPPGVRGAVEPGKC